MTVVRNEQTTTQTNSELSNASPTSRLSLRFGEHLHSFFFQIWAYSCEIKRFVSKNTRNWGPSAASKMGERREERSVSEQPWTTVWREKAGARKSIFRKEKDWRYTRRNVGRLYQPMWSRISKKDKRAQATNAICSGNFWECNSKAIQLDVRTASKWRRTIPKQPFYD